jgi:hypothetical protein
MFAGGICAAWIICTTISMLDSLFRTTILNLRGAFSFAATASASAGRSSLFIDARSAMILPTVAAISAIGSETCSVVE